MKIDEEENFYNKEIPLCIQDLLNHPKLVDPAYSIFRENVKLYKLAYFDGKFTKPNWNK